MTITNSVRLFQPLSGKELRKIMMDDFERLLDESGYFMEHLSFSLADVEISVKITSNPPLFNDIVLDSNRRLETDDVNSLTTEPKTVSFGGTRARVGEVPDAEREAHGLPTTEARRDETTGVIFDQKIEPTEVRNVATVGGGTKPRGRQAKATAAVESEPLLDDEGNPVNVNS
jgi:hypothetical protein